MYAGDFTAFLKSREENAVIGFSARTFILALAILT